MPDSSPKRPYIYESYYDPVRAERVKVLAISEFHVVCDGERIYDRQTFATCFMVYTCPQLGVYEGRITDVSSWCEECGE